MSQYYKKYMKKREEEKPSYLKLFIGGFLVMVVFFVILATHLVASVDTTIGENDEGDIKSSGLGVKKRLIDGRLKFIQMEDISGKPKAVNEKVDIDSFENTVEVKKVDSYKGQYEKTYNYEPEQKTQPYSPTYNNTKTQQNSATSSSQNVQRSYNIPISTPQAKPKTAPTPVSTHSIQKNLAPTGM